MLPLEGEFFKDVDCFAPMVGEFSAGGSGLEY